MCLLKQNLSRIGQVIDYLFVYKQLLAVIIWSTLTEEAQLLKKSFGSVRFQLSKAFLAVCCVLIFVVKAC